MGKKKKASGGTDAVRLYEEMDNRPVLMKLLIENNFQKTAFRKAVTTYVIEEKTRYQETKAGWYTETAMSSILGLSSSHS